MKLFRPIAFIAFVTCMALVYVHQSVEMLKISYSIDCKEKKVRAMTDYREAVMYTIDRLESPSRLSKALLDKNIDVAFPKRAEVVKLAQMTRPGSLGPTQKQLQHAGLERKVSSSAVFDFLAPRAEAQTRER